MPNLSIIQPGRLGDIIIMLPIANWYHKMGYHVVWPIHKPYLEMFTNAAPYVEFRGVDKINYGLSINSAGKVDRVIDTYFGFSDKTDLTKKWTDSGKQFDVYKYELARVPFQEKYNLDIKRNMEKENWLYEEVVGNKSKKYLVIHNRYSKGTRQIPADGNFDHVVTISEITRNVFDWLFILEKAQEYRMVDSCFANLVNQMNFDKPGTRYLRSKVFPVMNKNWKDVK